MKTEKELSGLEQNFFDLCQKALAATAYELYDLEYLSAQRLLRVYIFNPQSGSATLDDCVAVDRELTAPLAEQSWVPGQLRLEVSSPGLYRKLTSLAHFERAVGEQIELRLNKQEAGNRGPKSGSIKGQLQAVDERGVTLGIEGGPLTIDFPMIKRANVAPDHPTG